MLIDFHFEFTFVAIVTPMVKHNTGMKYTTEISVSLVAGRWLQGAQGPPGPQ